MKKCPQCAREYDPSMMFCLDDGAELLYGPASADEPATAILSEFRVSPSDSSLSESPTRAQIDITDETAILQTGTGEIVPKPHGLDKRFLVAPFLLAIIVLGGFFGYRYFKSGGTEQINSIAVLPFENRSSDADTDYLSDGLAESLIYRLSQLPNLKVSPTSSVFRYKGKETDPIIVAKELAVDSVLTGRITQRGDNLNISVNLVDTRNGKSLWGEQYERKMSELLATQREIAGEITNNLKLKLSGDSEQKLAKKYTDNNEAYQLFLKGRYHLGRRTKEDLLKGIGYFQQAIKLDSNFALAYARIAETYNQMPAYGYLSPREAVPQAKAAAQRSLEIDPSLAEGHAALANTMAVYEWQWAEAERGFKRAIELDPNSSSTYLRYAQVCLSPQGRSAEAIAAIKRTLEIEPLDISSGALSSHVYLNAQEYDRALELAKTYYELDPNHVSARYFLAEAYNGKGMYAEAISLTESSIQTPASSQLGLQSLGYAYARSGQRNKADEVISTLEKVAKAQYVPPYLVAVLYAAIGDREKAFAELEKSYAEHDWHCQRLKTDPQMAPLRDDPLYKDLLKRMNLQE